MSAKTFNYHRILFELASMNNLINKAYSIDSALHEQIRWKNQMVITLIHLINQGSKNGL